MVQEEIPNDYVIATWESHTVEELVRLAFACVDLNMQDHVFTDERFFRPAEVNVLCGDSSRGQKSLGWTPTIFFEDLIKMMVHADLELLKSHK